MPNFQFHLRQLRLAAKLGATLHDRLTLIRFCYSGRLRLPRSKDVVHVVQLRIGRRVVPWRLRDNDSDVGTVIAIVGSREYTVAGLSPAQVTRIIDLGGNIGASVLYFSQAYPNAEIVVVEPEPKNLELLEANLANVESRIHLFKEAVGATPGIGRFRVTDWSGGHSLETDVALPDSRTLERSIDVDVTTIEAIMARLQWDKVDLVKMDIEGGEVAVFRPDSAWPRHVRAVVGEYHGEAALAALRHAAKHQGFEFRVDPIRPLFCAVKPESVPLQVT